MQRRATKRRLPPEVFNQAGFGVCFEWGPFGAEVLAPGSDVVIVVDVLSFSTSVDIAVSRGATVVPVRWQDLAATAAAVAQGAVHAVGHGETGPDRPWSLSPSSLVRVPAGTRLAMPSPNGATITAAVAGGGAAVLAGCLRNARAVAAHALGIGHCITVIAAGERWPDGSLRPAWEDLVGAGLIIAHLAGMGGGPLSPEAHGAAAASRAAMPATQLSECASGRELIAKGYPADVALAAEVDVSRTVPVLRDGTFTLATQDHAPSISLPQDHSDQAGSPTQQRDG